MVLGWASDTRRKPKTILVGIYCIKHNEFECPLHLHYFVISLYTIMGPLPTEEAIKERAFCMFEGYDGME